MVQLAEDKRVTTNNAQEGNHFIGMMAAVGACCLSGFAGVYFEKILKGSSVSLWMRNVQLALCSVPFAIITYLLDHSQDTMERTYFYGYVFTI